ncbi:MAG: CHRD domain-containing protein [Ignavibacteriaceae bacterium]
MKRIALPFLLLILLTEKYYSNGVGGGTNSEIMFTTELNGANEVSSISTIASGTAWAILSDDRSTLYYRVTYAQLSSGYTSAYFRFGLPGINGSIMRAIQFNGNTASGSWTNLPDSIAGALLNGQVYINVGSANNPNGEIRGQLLLVEGLGFTISFNANTTRFNSDSTDASGTAWAILNNNGGTLTYHLTVAGLSSSINSADFNTSNKSFNEGNGEPINIIDSSAAGVWNGMDDVELDSLIHNNLSIYINTSNYPNSEIRGQVLRSGLIGFNASLDGGQEVPFVATGGSGTSWAVIDSDLSSLTYQITYAQLTSHFIQANFYQVNSGVDEMIRAITPYVGNTASGIWPDLPDSVIINLIKGNVYISVNSIKYPGGEIRGQLWMNNGVGFSANLTKEQIVTPAPINSSATGTAWLLYVNDSVKFQITFAGLSSGYYLAHIHDGESETNGPVVHPLTFADSTLNSYWSGIDDATTSDLFKGNLYIDIHSTAYQNGEIRGQVTQMSPTNIITGIQNKQNVLPVKLMLFQNYPNPFNPSTIISWQLPSSSIVKLKLYDILGREITTLINGFQNAGSHFLLFNAQQIVNHRQLASGIYFYKLDAGGFSSTKKMLYLK